MATPSSTHESIGRTIGSIVFSSCVKEKIDFHDVGVESGGLDTLDVYAKRRVREVWVWNKGRIDLFRLRGAHHRLVSRSRFVPGLDVGLMARFVDRQAAQAFLCAQAKT